MKNNNLTIICGSVEGTRINPTGFHSTIEIKANDVDIENLLEQIDRERITDYLGTLEPMESKETILDNRQYEQSIENKYKQPKRIPA